MGKGNRNRKKNKLKRNINKKNILSLYTVDELLNKATEELNVFNYEEAQKYCKEALKRDPDNLSALETSANLCIELGAFDNAKHCLGRAITLSPENGFSKYLSMGQLLQGEEALQCYVKGIELIETLIKETQVPANEKKQEESDKNICNGDTNGKDETIFTNPSFKLTRKLSNAFCAIAELYMSDLCDNEEAETESIANIEKAIKSDSENPEAYQQKANFLLVKEDLAEAKTNIKKSVSLWLPKYQEVDKGEATAGTFDPVDVCPLTESARFSTVRILIEVEEHDLASEILEGLLGENDEAPYTWYLMGWNLYLQGDHQKAEAKQHFLKFLEVHSTSPCDDEEVVNHTRELLNELKDVHCIQEENESDIEAQIDQMDLESNEMEVS